MFQLTCSVMTCHTPLSRLCPIMAHLRVLSSWRVWSLGKSSLRLHINILSFFNCCHITGSSPFLLLDKIAHRSQQEGRRSCWSRGKSEACIFLWSAGLAFLLRNSICSEWLFRQTGADTMQLTGPTSHVAQIHVEREADGKCRLQVHWIAIMKFFQCLCFAQSKWFFAKKAWNWHRCFRTGGLSCWKDTAFNIAVHQILFSFLKLPFQHRYLSSCPERGLPNQEKVMLKWKD